MKTIVSVAFATVGLFVTACQPVGDPICALSSGFTLTSSASAVTTAQAITLTAEICDGVSVSSIAFFDGTAKIGEQAVSSGTRSDAQNKYKRYSLSVNLAKAQNGSRTYTAQTTTQRGSDTTSPVTVNVNVP